MPKLLKQASTPCSLPPPPPTPAPCRAAKLRRLALRRIQKSTARKLRLGRREAAMAEALREVGWREGGLLRCA